MLKKLLLLSAMVPVGLISQACTGETTGDDDDATADPPVVIVEANPEPGEDNFFFQSPLWVEFDRAPDSATITLSGPDGDVAGTQESDNNGRVERFTPSAALTPSASYTMTVSWSPSEGDLSVDFQTGPYGGMVGTPGDLVDMAFNIDLAGAEFVEPPGVGPILQSQIGDIAIVFSPLATSDFDAGEIHIVGALGEDSGGNITQDTCQESLAFTYGPDGALGGGDDVPAGWSNPDMELGPTDLSISVQGIEATIQDLVITGTFHPDLVDMRGGTFAGKVDTRPLAPELDPEGGEGAICDLVEETIGVGCEECGGDNPGEFCLSVLAEDIVAEEVPGLTVAERGCADILADAACADDHGDYDEDDDGTYELCPEFVQ
jgi:hypothetical protein